MGQERQKLTENNTLRELSLSKKSYPKRKLPGQDEPLLVVADLGNSNWRIMVHGHYADEVLLPHAVSRIEQGQFEDMRGRHRGPMPTNTSIFYVKELESGFAIGEQARQSGSGFVLKGRAKYREDHWGAGFIALLLQLYPDGHKNIIVNYAHPSDITDKDTERMVEALRVGKMWTVDTIDGKTVRYRFIAKTSIEESTASFLRFLLNENQSIRADLPSSVQPDTRYIVVTVGGLISHIDAVAFTKKGRVEFGGLNVDPIDYGIMNVKADIQRRLRKVTFEFNGNEVAPLEDAQTVDERIIDQVLLTGYFDLYGNGIFVKDMRKDRDEAMKPLVEAFSKQVKERFNNGAGYQGVIIGGGGSAVSFEYVQNNVFPMMVGYVYPTANTPSRLVFDVINGASRGWDAAPVLEKFKARLQKKAASKRGSREKA